MDLLYVIFLQKSKFISNTQLHILQYFHMYPIVVFFNYYSRKLFLSEFSYLYAFSNYTFDA